MAIDNSMIVNRKKTKTMLFNSSKTIDFEPFLTDPQGGIIEYLDKTKLLGVIITDDLKTEANTCNIEKKAYMRIWYLKRLLNLGCSCEDLILVYIRQVRSVVEFAAPYWTPLLTKNEVRRLERIQRTALHVIMGDSYTNYKETLTILGLESLEDRRNSLMVRFVIKTLQTNKFQHWFVRNTEGSVNTRNIRKEWKEPLL